VKRFLALLAVAGAAAAALAVPSGAVDTQGPPCANIASGDGGFVVTDTSSSLDWRFVLEARSCAVVTYTLDIYDLSGQTLLATETFTGVSGATSLTFSETFDEALAGVCLVGTTSIGRHVADRAPDAECLPVTPDSSGGVGFQ
jgi:hypothetical protein